MDFIFLSAIYHKSTCPRKSELNFTDAASCTRKDFWKSWKSKEHPCFLSPLKYKNLTVHAFTETLAVHFLPRFKVIYSVQGSQNATKSKKQLGSLENPQKGSPTTFSFLEVTLSGATSHQEIWLNHLTFNTVRVCKQSLKECKKNKGEERGQKGHKWKLNFHFVSVWHLFNYV